MPRLLPFVFLCCMLVGLAPLSANDDLSFFRDMDPGDTDSATVTIEANHLEDVGDSDTIPAALRNNDRFMAWRPGVDQRQSTYEVFFIPRTLVETYLDVNGDFSTATVTLVFTYMGQATHEPEDPRMAAPTSGFTYHHYMASIIDGG